MIPFIKGTKLRKITCCQKSEQWWPLKVKDYNRAKREFLGS